MSGTTGGDKDASRKSTVGTEDTEVAVATPATSRFELRDAATARRQQTSARIAYISAALMGAGCVILGTMLVRQRLKLKFRDAAAAAPSSI